MEIANRRFFSNSEPGLEIYDITLTDGSMYSNDTEPPTFEHTLPEIAYEAMALHLNVDVQDIC
ncbi:hypothetical protein GMD78_06055 [Ornithinibacillus sp. L9]|uniref:Uncharacterized protein n=1 Tax=Ornithinibacillus caprae TaxID=2678566 RepID=A0A6N8FEJ1_9BACI|nr:hypothetical protein [Ornithinibacillus caprae]MUK87960.1 hypothetical protein [Ornithinibacillus caprae]